MSTSPTALAFAVFTILSILSLTTFLSSRPLHPDLNNNNNRLLSSFSSSTSSSNANPNINATAYALERKRALGRAGWYFLHSVAAHWTPEHDPDGLSAKMLLQSVADLYPCELCRDHFQQFLIAHPPVLQSAETFLKWTCDAHNEVNRRNLAPIFDCNDHPKLKQLYGDCGCDAAT